ncbi:hypothetical protein HK405_008330 [Cladochytrium tenue]|nr:hypothetical protein HK405_008330 [Cladochytrium tenue]
MESLPKKNNKNTQDSEKKRYFKILEDWKAPAGHSFTRAAIRDKQITTPPVPGENSPTSVRGDGHRDFKTRPPKPREPLWKHAAAMSQGGIRVTSSTGRLWDALALRFELRDTIQLPFNSKVNNLEHDLHSISTEANGLIRSSVEICTFEEILDEDSGLFSGMPVTPIVERSNLQLPAGVRHVWSATPSPANAAAGAGGLTVAVGCGNSTVVYASCLDRRDAVLATYKTNSGSEESLLHNGCRNGSIESFDTRRPPRSGPALRFVGDRSSVLELQGLQSGPARLVSAHANGALSLWDARCGAARLARLADPAWSGRLERAPAARLGLALLPVSSGVAITGGSWADNSKPGGAAHGLRAWNLHTATYLGTVGPAAGRALAPTAETSAARCTDRDGRLTVWVGVMSAVQRWALGGPAN